MLLSERFARIPITVVTVVTCLFWLAAFSPGNPVYGQTAAARGGIAATIEFNRDVRPILAALCFECHGFDSHQRKADLRLDTAEGAFAEHNGITAVKPGDPSASELWNRITSTDPDVVMPPPETGKSMTVEQRQILRRWIEQGASYQQHWAFETPVVQPEPTVRDTLWPRNAIDYFILSRLEQEGLQPQPEAGREILIRRAAFALTGLPPTVAEVDRYLSDKSVDAYAAMVERYLASPRFGEEQARHWLDVARYADTHGLHLDNEREMWEYRDWVIRAFNQNLPFDQFTTWQLAGDLLPEPSPEQLVATGFNRCNVTTSEGGAIADEWLYRYAVDRTSTTMQAWMGLTAGCAVCHDHKYDPITQRDFYSMYAFFYSAGDPAMDGNIRNTQPFMKVPNPDQAAALQKSGDRETALRQQLSAALDGISWVDPAMPTENTQELRPVSDVLIDEIFPLGSKAANTSRNPVQWVLDPEYGVQRGRRAVELAFGSRFDLTLTLIPLTIPAEDGRLEFWVRIDPFHAPAAFAVQIDAGNGAKRAVWGDLESFGGSGHQHQGALPEHGQWVRLNVDLHQLGCKPGTRIRSVVLTHTGGRICIDDMRITGRNQPSSDPLSSFQQWWQTSKDTKPEGIPKELSTVLTAGPRDEAAPDLRKQLLQFYLTHVHRISESPVAEIRTELLAVEQDIAAVNDSVPGTFVFNEIEKPRDAFVMLRGQYDKLGDRVEPDVPGAFPPLRNADGKVHGADERATRLDLVRWMLSEENPLTARVTVNRIWQQLFGTGLVMTSDDFGTRGDFPSHPELLDWLAVHFRQSGWDTKQLLRLILNSSTFRQQAVVSESLYQKDPANRLLARGPRFRLDAEQLRDNALFVSGLMNLQMGGRGVLPYQPADIWEPVGYQNSNTRFYMQDHGSALYRRSVYCFLKRTAPPPFMSNFDGPNREQFCTRRERSNTPLQALQLMNDIQHFEAARVLAERVLMENGSATDERLRFLYRTVLSRLPNDEELQLLRTAVEVQYSLFAQEPESADKAIHVGEAKPRKAASPVETAAWTMIANLVLNLDETVSRN